MASTRAVVGFLREGERVTGVRVATTGPASESRSGRAQVDQRHRACGPTTSRHLVGERGKFKVRASKGIHLVVPRDRIQLDTGLILRTEKSVLFVIPWGRHWIVGTTDTDWELDKAHPARQPHATSTTCSSTSTGARAAARPTTDVEGVYAGLRPLLTGESEGPASCRREHTVAVPVPGLVAVAGGKYTTYRVMARDAVDAAARGLDRRSRRAPPTDAAGRRRGLPRAVEPAPAARRARAGCTWRAIEHLLRRYGSRIDELLELVARAPGARPSRCRAPTTTCAVEVWYAADARGRAAPRRRAHPAHADLDRDVGPRARGRRAGRRG